MKLTYAQKAEIAQKAIKVCDSVKRSNQTDIASIYADKAISVISDCDINKDVYASKADMNQRIADKPRYKYSHSTGEWVRSLTFDERFDAFHSRCLDQAIASQSSPSNHMNALRQASMLNNHNHPYWIGQGALGSLASTGY